MKNKNFFVPVTLAVLTACSAFAAVWIEEDAGDIVDAPPEFTAGDGSLELITGTTSQPDDEVDAFLIDIVDPASFYATANPLIGMGTGFGAFDSRLYLFTVDGDPVMGNDDVQNAPGQVQRSTISDPGIWTALTGGSLGANPPAPLTPGPYILAITDWDNDPQDAAGTLMIATVPAPSLGGPEPGLVGPIASWSGNRGVDASAGDYGIELVGATFASAQVPFLITDITLEEDGQITLTWNSRPGETYTIFFSNDLADFGADIADDFSSQGDTTTSTFVNPTVSAKNPSGSPTLFFRVGRN